MVEGPQGKESYIIHIHKSIMVEGPQGKESYIIYCRHLAASMPPD